MVQFNTNILLSFIVNGKVGWLVNGQFLVVYKILLGVLICPRAGLGDIDRRPIGVEVKATGVADRYGGRLLA